jgi:aquaporin Z
MVLMEPAAPPGFAPLAIGTVLALMVFAGGHISGGHYNPAVSLAVFLRVKSSAIDLFLYWVAQLVGGAVAAFLVLFLKGFPAVTPFAPDVFRALVAEFVFTFALCFVVLNVATARGTEGNSYYGWAIGMTVLVGAYAVGAVSGAAFNPAVAFGASLMGLFSWTNIWIYLLAELAAAAAAAYVFKAAHPGE